MGVQSGLIGVTMVALLVQGAPVLAQQNLQGGIQDLVRQIIVGMEQEQKRKLAILDLTKLDASVDNFTRYLTEQLVTRMVIAKRNFDVIERRHLDKLLAEHGLNLSGALEPQNIKRVGRLSGIDAIATGSVTELPAALEVATRLIDTETGNVFAAAITRFTKDREVQALLGIGGREQAETEHPPVLVPPPRTTENATVLSPAEAVKELRRIMGRNRNQHTPVEVSEEYMTLNVYMCAEHWHGGHCVLRDVNVELENVRSVQLGVIKGVYGAELCFDLSRIEYPAGWTKVDDLFAGSPRSSWRVRRSDWKRCSIMAATSAEEMNRIREVLAILLRRSVPFGN